jgi:hypothetical protein
MVMSRLENALWEADAAFHRLEPEQGRVARRNARQAMLKALRKARMALDAEFPQERKTVKRRRKNRSVDAQLVGFAVISDEGFRSLSLAGVKKTQFRSAPSPLAISSYKRKLSANKRCERRGERKIYQNLSEPPQVIWAPIWMINALRIGVAPADIAKAVRSKTKRASIETFVRLRGVTR